jgi:hypothetical protein
MVKSSSAWVRRREASVEQVVGDDHVTVLVPDHEVRVRAHGDGALARVETVELGRVGGRECHEGGHVDPPLEIGVRSYITTWSSDVLISRAHHVESQDLVPTYGMSECKT